MTWDGCVGMNCYGCTVVLIVLPDVICDSFAGIICDGCAGIVRYHCGGWSEEVNSCILILSYMVIYNLNTV
jgi:hypothetical protein